MTTSPIPNGDSRHLLEIILFCDQIYNMGDRLSLQTLAKLEGARGNAAYDFVYKFALPLKDEAMTELKRLHPDNFRALLKNTEGLDITPLHIADCIETMMSGIELADEEKISDLNFQLLPRFMTIKVAENDCLFAKGKIPSVYQDCMDEAIEISLTAVAVKDEGIGAAKMHFSINAYDVTPRGRDTDDIFGKPYRKHYSPRTYKEAVAILANCSDEYKQRARSSESKILEFIEAKRKEAEANNKGKGWVWSETVKRLGVDTANKYLAK